MIVESNNEKKNLSYINLKINLKLIIIWLIFIFSLNISIINLKNILYKKTSQKDQKKKLKLLIIGLNLKKPHRNNAI